MHEPTPIATILIIIITVLASWRGFKDPAIIERYIFCPEYILRDKQGYRLVTSAFLHADAGHLAFNMFSFYMFGRHIELNRGVPDLLIVYFASIIGGGLLSLYLHRHHEYRAYGASGGVCGVIFAYLFLFPGSGVMFPPFTFVIPAWVYTTVYLLASFLGVRRGTDNIGHDAHLGGAVIGLLAATALHPEIVRESPWLYLLVMAISLGLFIYFFKNPLFLPLKNYVERDANPEPPAKPPATREAGQEEINAILDKISRSGINSLTEAEHKTLLKASRKTPEKAKQR